MGQVDTAMVCVEFLCVFVKAYCNHLVNSTPLVLVFWDVTHGSSEVTLVCGGEESVQSGDLWISHSERESLLSA